MIGIIILNYNSWEQARQCINSILKAEDRIKINIYLVDNASTKRPENEILEFLKNNKVTLISNPDNKGYAAGNNVGTRCALNDGYEAILISNSDIIFYKNSISVLYEYLQKHPTVGIVGPKIKRLDGTTQRECMAMKTGLKEKYLLRTRLKIFFPRFNQQYWGRQHDYEKDIFQVYAVLGCCFMISELCAKDITPLDEHTFLYEEELILGILMEQKGWKTVYNPQSIVLHKHEVSTGGIRNNPFAYTCQICSEIYYCKMYLGTTDLQILPIWYYRTGLYLLRMLKSSSFRKYWGQYMSRCRQSFKTFNRPCV